MASHDSSKAIPTATLGKTPVKTDAQYSALGYFNADAAIEQPNGTFLVGADCARDQAAMRSAQLVGLLSLMNVDGAKGFLLLNDSNKQQLLWMATELAEELRAVLPLATAEAGRLAREICGGAQ